MRSQKSLNQWQKKDFKTIVEEKKTMVGMVTSSNN